MYSKTNTHTNECSPDLAATEGALLHSFGEQGEVGPRYHSKLTLRLASDVA